MRTQYCFHWCGRLGCECSRSDDYIPPIPIYTPTTEDELSILGINDLEDLNRLLTIVKNESDDVLRAVARAKLEGNAVSIIENLVFRLRGLEK